MYRLIRSLCAVSIVALALTQCTQMPDNEVAVNGGENPLAAKIVHSSEGASNGVLLVKFNENTSIAIESTSRSGEVTRTNNEKLNSVLDNIGAESIIRLFPVDERHEERTREAGLHRWYIINFDKQQSLDKVATRLSEIDVVDKVQFDVKVTAPQPQRSNGGATLSTSTTRLSTPQFNDPMAHLQWDLKNNGDFRYGDTVVGVAGMDINVHEAWKYTTGDPSIIVAVMDQGVDYTHEDLVANMWVNEGEIPNDSIDNDKNGYVDDIHGFNHVTGVYKNGKWTNGELNWNMSPNDIGHGTHCAGTIAAENNNGKGINGIAGGDGSGNGVRLMSAQIFCGNLDNTGSSAVVAQAFKYAADNGAVISSNSWGMPPREGQNDGWFEYLDGGAEFEAIKYFTKVKNHSTLKGGLVIFASGNDSAERASYPGSYRDFICVSSFAVDGMPANYSNHGPGVNITAPGGDQLRHGESGGILSTVSKGYDEESVRLVNGEPYTFFQGTSMACPHVTGVAALGLSYAKALNKSFSLEEFKSMILLSVNDIDQDLKDTKFSKYLGKMGTGRIDAFRMLMNVEGIACIPVVKGEDRFKIDMNEYLAEGEAALKVTDFVISDKDKKRLGVTYTRVGANNQITITCSNAGSAIVSVKMIAGGDKVGTNDNPGGMEITKQFALIVREGFSSNGGWM